MRGALVLGVGEKPVIGLWGQHGFNQRRLHFFARGAETSLCRSVYRDEADLLAEGHQPDFNEPNLVCRNCQRRHEERRSKCL
jgi:hypothetical protein